MNTIDQSDAARPLAARAVARFAALPAVVAVALGGSAATGAADAVSDIDLYVYTRSDVPLADREALVAALGGASRADLGLTYWGAGDEWIDAATGIEMDATYFDADWMAAQLRRVLVDHRPSEGYTTCFWHTIRHSRPLHDPTGWFAALQATARAPYPEPLRQAIIAYNHPLLRGIIPSYYVQVAKAVERGDAVSVNHRLAALLASYFDILFAANRVPHPGEKRLVERALALCPNLPEGFAGDVAAVLVAGGSASPETLAHLTRLLDRLDAWLA